MLTPTDVIDLVLPLVRQSVEDGSFVGTTLFIIDHNMDRPLVIPFPTDTEQPDREAMMEVAGMLVRQTGLVEADGIVMVADAWMASVADKEHINLHDADGNYVPVKDRPGAVEAILACGSSGPDDYFMVTQPYDRTDDGIVWKDEKSGDEGVQAYTLAAFWRGHADEDHDPHQ